jgi:20S proteasome alpha/beta subunit
MLDVSGCSVEKQAIGEGEQRAIPAFSHSISEAKTIAVSQLRAVIADCATKSADNFRHHF